MSLVDIFFLTVLAIQLMTCGVKNIDFSEFHLTRAVGLETDFLWSRLFCTGIGRGLEPSWSQFRSLKLVSRPANFCK